MGEEFLEEVSDNQKGKYMTFRCGKESFAIEIKYVNEIIGMQNITAVPEVENYIKGLINLRGKIIPVIDVKVRFKQDPFEYTDRTCIIVVDVQSIVVGLIIESIAEVVNIEDKDILPPPAVGHSLEQNKYVYGIGKVGERVHLLLDPQKLIRDDEMDVLMQMVDDADDEQAE